MIEQPIGELIFVETEPDRPNVLRKPDRCSKCILRADMASPYWEENTDGCLMDAAMPAAKAILQCSPHRRADKRTGYFALRVPEGTVDKMQVELFIDSEEGDA